MQASFTRFDESERSRFKVPRTSFGVDRPIAPTTCNLIAIISQSMEKGVPHRKWESFVIAQGLDRKTLKNTFQLRRKAQRLDVHWYIVGSTIQSCPCPDIDPSILFHWRGLQIIQHPQSNPPTETYDREPTLSMDSTRPPQIFEGAMPTWGCTL